MRAILKTVSIEGFTSIARLKDLEIGPLTVLVGANGAGKSNFLQFFQMLNYMMSGTLQKYVGLNGGPNSLFHFGKKTQFCGGKVQFETDAGLNTYEFTLTRTRDDAVIFTDEAVDFRGKGKTAKPEPLGIGAGHRESALLLPQNQKRLICRVFSGNLTGFRAFQFHDTSANSFLRSRSRTSSNRYLQANGGNLASVLLLLRDRYPQEYQMVVKTVRLVAPFFEDFVLEPDNAPEEPNYRKRLDDDVQGDPWILLRWRSAEPDYDLGVHQLSDGTLRFIALATLLLLPAQMRHAAIFIDEPELGLHPYAIRLLGSLIKSAAAHSQIVVTTQSPLLLDQFEPEDVVTVQRREHGSEFTRLKREELKEWLEDYTLGDVWARNLLGGGPAHE
jgi:predicted ATPase